VYQKLKILSAHNGNTELIESMRIICSDMGQRIRVAREAEAKEGFGKLIGLLNH
jgi:hypothetical protein